MRVLVLGAGVIGVASAWYLAKAGHEVTVLDRQPGAGLETSFANGGQISASHAEPWASPYVLPKILKWLGREDAPLIVRWRADPALFEWGLRFLRNCTPARTRINTERTLRVALYSRACIRALRLETGIAYDHLSRGILHFYRDAREFDHAARMAALMSELGCRRDVVDAERCTAIEPALRPMRHQLEGGIHSPDDESGDAHLFTRHLAELCAAKGVEFRYGGTIRRILGTGQAVAGVEMADGTTVSADAYVVALGSFSPLMLRPLGIRLPIYPAKGYSVTMPAGRGDVAPSVSLTDDERKIVYSRLGDRLRIAGTAELAGYDDSLGPVRSQAILKAARDLFPQAGDFSKAEFWAGLRPVTPDSVPIIGRHQQSNLYFNTGHGTLGWTMCCGSGKLIADLIGGQTPDIDCSGLGPNRF